MDPIFIAILPEWKKKADDYALAARMPSMKTGKIAEYAVVHYFRTNGVFVREDETPKNQPDYFDVNFGNALADVKSCLPPAQELRITKYQYDRGRRFDFYIGVQVDAARTMALIFGYCKKDEVKKARSRWIGQRKVYIIPFSKLHPIGQLLKAFKREGRFVF